MAGDYSRLTFDPGRDIAALLSQQGRPLLDADVNELMELLERRLRAGSFDTFGACVVPRTTEDGFRLDWQGGVLTIGVGRMYVHGLLVENHGTGARTVEPGLQELRGADPTPVQDQPWGVQPATVPTSGRHLGYVTAWLREVTAAEDPSLVDVAVNVDTATRLEAAWQVGFHAVDGTVTCATPDDQIAGWQALTSPSPSRLTVTAADPPAPTDPCTLPPTTGYRGVENRLYRVEVLAGGPAGTATFAWSRDNASVAAPVLALNAARDVLTVARVGRDAQLRLREGSWVEVTDDRRELSGLAGVLGKVVEVNDTLRTVTLAAALPAGVFDPADPERHTRVRRWDQSGNVRRADDTVYQDVDATGGAITIPAGGTVLKLEDGIRVAFATQSAAGDTSFRTGDYWVFAARTATGEVEELTAAPPRGPKRFHCRLAVLDFDTGEATDCRVLWPPDAAGEESCDCTVCVTADSHNSGERTIQAAVDEVKDEGGTVCLGPGTYRLAAPVRIFNARSVRLHGHGLSTLLMADGPVILVDRSADIEIDRLAALGQYDDAGDGREGVPVGPSWAAVGISSSARVLVDRCGIAAIGNLDKARSADGAGALVSWTGAAVGLLGLGLDVRVTDNLLAGGYGIATVTGGDGAATTASEGFTIGPGRGSYSALLATASGNLVAGFRTGIDLDERTMALGALRIDGNVVFGGRSAGIRVAGTAVAGSRYDVCDNAVGSLGDGIVVEADRSLVRDNTVRVADQGVCIGVDADDEVVVDECVIEGNDVTDGAFGIAFDAQVDRLVIDGNRVARSRTAGIAGSARGHVRRLVVRDNVVTDVGRDEGGETGPAGISVASADDAVIRGNAVEDVATRVDVAVQRAGIAVLMARRADIAGNTIRNVGPFGRYAGVSVGIAVRYGFEQADVSDNDVLRQQEGAEAGDARGIWLGERRLPDRRGRREAMASRLRPRPEAHEDVYMVHFGDDVVITDGDRFQRIKVGQALAAVRGNDVVVDGWSAAVDVLAPGNGMVTENRCRLVGAGHLDEAVVVVASQTAIAGNNYVEAGADRRSVPAVSLRVADDSFTVVGNVANGEISVNGVPLDVPWRPLNVVRP